MQKRDGTIVPFDEKRIVRAISRALSAVIEGGEQDAVMIADKVYDALVAVKKSLKEKNFVPSVELIQDIVENQLIAMNFSQTAKAYIT